MEDSDDFIEVNKENKLNSKGNSKLFFNAGSLQETLKKSRKVKGIVNSLQNFDLLTLILFLKVSKRGSEAFKVFHQLFLILFLSCLTIFFYSDLKMKKFISGADTTFNIYVVNYEVKFYLKT